MPLQEFPPAQTITNPVIQGGITGNILFFGAGSTISQSSSLFWDNVNLSLSIGTIKFFSLNNFTLTGGVNAGNLVASGGGNVVYGTNTFQSATVAAVSCSFFGNNAGLSVTSGGTLSGFGENALKLETNGVRSAAMGGNCLANIIGGTDNLGCGYAAGFGITGGNWNTAIGCTTLHFSASMNKCTAVGFASGYVNTADEFTALGYNSGNANTSGLRNTYIGSACGAGNATGNDNTAVGRSALPAIGNMNQCTAVGSGALQLNTGDNNTGIGYQALNAMVSGTLNVAVGAIAGFSAIGTGNVYIGRNAGSTHTGGTSTFIGTGSATSSAGANASIALGNGATVTGSGQCVIGEASSLTVIRSMRDNQVDLGGTSFQWKNIYVATSVTFNAANIVTDTTTGTKIGTATNQKFGFFNATPVVQQTRGATFTNNITSGGTTDSPANWTDLTTYATDAAAIRNFCYQMARAMNQHDVALRALGLLT